MAADIVPYKPPGAVTLPDTSRSEHQFEIHSETSNRVYVIGRDKKAKKWFCTCPGWKRWRKCKHLIDGCGLPESMILGRDKLSANERHMPSDEADEREGGSLDPLSVNYVKPKPGGPRIPIPVTRIKRKALPPPRRGNR